MDAATGSIPAGVAVIHSTARDPVGEQLRTKESIDPRITVSLVEIDAQSAQYSCEVTIANASDEEFSVSEVRPRLPKGVRLNEAVDSTQVALVKRYEEICRGTGGALTAAALLSDPQFAADQAKKVREQIRAALKPRNLFELYFYPLIGRIPAWIQATRERAFKVDVGSAADAEAALAAFAVDPRAPDRKLVEYNIDLLKRMEQDDDFRTHYQKISLKKGQQHKAIYIVCGTRGALNPTPYSIGFEIVLQRETYLLSRVEYATVTVPPGSFWPTVVAMASAAIGALIQRYDPNVTEGTPPVLPAAQIGHLAEQVQSIVIPLGVPVLTALIVYNIYDLTTLKDRLNVTRSWRSAVFIGFLCGFLNTKILAALGALLG